MTTGTTDVTAVPSAALKLAQSGTFTVADLADAVAPAAEPEALGFPPLPKPAVLTDQAAQAVSRVSEVFGSFQLPSRRVLTAKELARLTDEAVTLVTAAKPIKARLDVIAETLRVHMDVTAEAAGAGPATERIQAGLAKGHYLVAKPGEPYKVPVPGFEEAWEQRYVAGGAAPNPARLLGLEQQGQITHEEYLSLTRETRVFDEEKMASVIRKNAARGIQILGEITERSSPGAQLVTPRK